MKRFCNAALLCLCFAVPMAKAQKTTALKDVNFKYKYDVQSPIRCYLRPIRGEDKMYVYYHLTTTSGTLSSFAIAWEKRTSMEQVSGTPLTGVENNIISQGPNYRYGFLTMEIPEKPWLLVSRMQSLQNKSEWYHYMVVEKTYPVNGWLEQNEQIVRTPYLLQKDSFLLRAPKAKPFSISYYRDSFPPPLPPYAAHEAQSNSRFLFRDSILRVSPSSQLHLKNPGLYLFQQDSSAAEGFAYRVMPNTFPKFTRIDELAEPLIYVCAPDESESLRNAGDDKAAFDQVILSIMGGKEEASRFMRNYFRRVEEANLLFTTYKIGWKTDQGMIYIIFGPPNWVRAFGNGESWVYKSANAEFVFAKNGSVYDPNYMVLLRDKKFEEPWFIAVDRIRKAKF